MDVNSSHWQAEAKRAQQKSKVVSGMGSRRSLASLAANADPPAEPEPSPEVTRRREHAVRQPSQSWTDAHLQTFETGETLTGGGR